MNTGSIDNPATFEARLFAFLRDHINYDFTSGELAQVLDGTPCAHSYIAGLRVQLRERPEMGYRLTDKRWDKTKGKRGAYVYRLVKVAAAVPSVGQMELVA